MKPPNMNTWIKKNYMSNLGIFQYVREILQLSLLIDHPVALSVWVGKWFEDMEEKDNSLNQLMSNGGVCRKDPATPVLLISKQTLIVQFLIMNNEYHSSTKKGWLVPHMRPCQI